MQNNNQVYNFRFIHAVKNGMLTMATKTLSVRKACQKKKKTTVLAFDRRFLPIQEMAVQQQETITRCNVRMGVLEGEEEEKTLPLFLIARGRCIIVCVNHNKRLMRTLKMFEATVR